jgi:TIGR03009 family protein
MKFRRMLLGSTLSLSSIAWGVADAQSQQYPATGVAAQPAATTSAIATQPYNQVNQVAAVGVGQPMPQAGGALGAPAAGPNGGPVGAPAGAAPGLPPGPPFQLSEIEQAEVFRLLKMWEDSSAKVNTFNTEFERWEYDGVFGPGADTPMIKATGTLSFSKPDKGSFKIDSISRWTKADAQNAEVKAPGDWLPKPDEIGEHWVCDGKAVYEYNHRDKQLVVVGIPEEMRGQKIVDGPLPFLFGAEANKLMTRYWIRSKQSGPDMIWLEAHPRWQSDAANYDMVDVMLDRKTMQPKAIQVSLPGGQQRHVYMFKTPKVNETNLGAWFPSLFSAPRTPLGWTRVMADDTNPAAAAPQAANPNQQAPLQR